MSNDNDWHLTNPWAVGLRGAAISVASIVTFSEVAGLGMLYRQEHLVAYAGAVAVAFALHAVIAWGYKRGGQDA